MTRDILDVNNVKIGELTLPDDTPESVWQEKLNSYKVVPQSKIPDVTPRQFRKAIARRGISVSVIEAAIASLPEPYKTDAQIEWEFSLAFKRDNPLIAMIAPVIGYDSAMLDELWIFAGAL